ncbi:MAG: transposase [Limisphaerales bacterium]
MREEIGELLEPMVAVADRIESHLKGILAHWKQGLTTAFTEGLNSALLRCRAQGKRVSISRAHDHDALFRRRKTPPSVSLIH